MTETDKIIDAFAELVAAKVLAKLGTTPRTTYTTAKSGPFVPGKSRAWMLRMVKKMPGARPVGRDWLMSADDFDRWAAGEDVKRLRKASGHAEANSSTEALADRFLKRGGFRSTKGAA